MQLSFHPSFMYIALNMKFIFCVWPLNTSQPAHRFFRTSLLAMGLRYRCMRYDDNYEPNHHREQLPDLAMQLLISDFLVLEASENQ
jgi:hypothetical protein